MDSNWLGKTVSLDCGGVGHFQGVIDSVHLDEQTITLKKAFQNGLPCKVPSVTIRADHIQDLNFIEEGSASTSSDSKSSKGGKASAVSTVEVMKKAWLAESLMKIEVKNAPTVKDQGATKVVSPKKGMVKRQQYFRTYFKDFSKTNIIKGDVVVGMHYGQWCNAMMVAKEKDYPKIKQVDNILAKSNLEPVLGPPQQGQMVAIKTADIHAEGAYHRAVIRCLNKGQGIVKANLIDHGINVIESAQSLAQLPAEALNDKKYPAFACFIQVAGVGELISMKHDVTQKSFDGLLGANLTVAEVGHAEKAGRWPPCVLTHPDGQLISTHINSISSKLQKTIPSKLQKKKERQSI